MLSVDGRMLLPETSSWRRMRWYASLTEKLDIILFGRGGEIVRDGNLTIYSTSANRPFSLLVGLIKGLRLVKKEKYDLITSQDPFELGSIAYLLKKTGGGALQLQLHVDFFNPYFVAEMPLLNWWRVAIAKWLLPKAEGIRANQEKMKDYLISQLKIPQEKIAVFQNFVDYKKINQNPPRFDLRKKYYQFDFIILMASRLVKQKNILLALRALREVIKKYPRTGLVIVGSGPEESSLKTAAGTAANNVVFEPWSDDMISYYKTSDLFLLTSNYEAWALTAVEAVAAGLPVVMTDVGCAGEFIKDGENGLVFPINDVRLLTEKILVIRENEDLKKKLISGGQKSIRPFLDLTLEKYLKIYKDSWENCLR